MPSFGSYTADEDRLREALRTLLERLGVLEHAHLCSQQELDDKMIDLAKTLELKRDELVSIPELDEGIPF